MPVNMSFGLISAHKPPSSTVLLCPFSEGAEHCGLEVKALEACARDGWPPCLARCSLGTPFTLSIPPSPVKKTQWQCLQERESPVHGCIRMHLMFSVLH